MKNQQHARRCLVGLCVVGWVTVTGAILRTAPQDEGSASSFDRGFRDELLDRTGSLPRLRSLLISIDGELAEEHYYHGFSAGRTANLKSASKTIIGILVGIAIDQGYLAGVDQTITEFFPTYLDGPAKKAITIEDLLSMRSGLETTSNRNYGRWVQSGNWVQHVLTRPLVDRPGGRMIYSTGSTHVLSAILTKATGTSTLEFGRRYLAQPLGIALPAWQRDPQGIYFGGNEMQVTPRAMLKIGELYLKSGVWGGRRIVSEGWVHASLVPRTWSRFSGRQYGYGWWMRTMAGRRVYYAWGYGGQFVFLVPDLEMAVVITSSPVPDEGRRWHLRMLYELVENQLIPAAVRAAEGAL